MTQIPRILSAAALAGALLASGQATAYDLAAAAVSHPCAGCHGPVGASVGDAPVIGGLDEGYLAATMRHYRDGQRHATIMNRIAKGYDDAQIAAMAEFFSAQPWLAAAVQTDPARVERGRELHTANACAGCHGPVGVSLLPNAPRLAGQYPAYLKLQMQYYADADKAIPPAAVGMRSMLAKLDDGDFEDLAHFYASQGDAE